MAAANVEDLEFIAGKGKKMCFFNLLLNKKKN